MKYLLIIVVIFITYSCCKDDEELILKRNNFTGNQLKINGYYYSKNNIYFHGIYCFYNNGIIIVAGGIFSNISEMNDYLIKEFINNNSYKNEKLCWGVFNINNNLIEIEYWEPSAHPYKTYIRSGLILNDTTFTFTKLMRSNGSDVFNINEVYHFQTFSPKPDSTNNFIH